VVAVIEHGTVTGNVSRTHKPCGACGELVEACGHLGSARTQRRRVQMQSPEQRAMATAARERRKARAQREIADMRRVLGGDQ
jgi:hypothetical protein